MIKNLLFDLGGVIMDIKRENCVDALTRLGMDDADSMLGVYAQSGEFALLEDGKLTADGVSTAIELNLTVTGELIIDKIGTLPKSSQTVLLGKKISLPKTIPALLINGEITSVKAEYEWTASDEIGKKQNKMTLTSDYAFAEGIPTEYTIEFDVKDFLY